MTQDRPDSAELLDALAEYLFGEVRAWAPREERFKALVAANLCAVVARELRAGEEPLAADRELFAALLGQEMDDVRSAQRELAAEVRAGEWDEQLGKLVGALREHVGRKLAVARPGYADPEPSGRALPD